MMPDLLEFTKELLGFYGTESDSVLSLLVLASEQYLKNAGVKTPLTSGDEEYALYQVAVATKVKILHDGDPRGELEKVLTSIVLQIKDYGGETE